MIRRSNVYEYQKNSKLIKAEIFAAKGILKATPVSAVAAALSSLATSMIIPARLMATTALIDAVVTGEYRSCLRRLAFLICTYFASYILNFIEGTATSAGVYEKGVAHFRALFCKKLSRLKFIDYENTEKMNMLERAQDTVANERMATIYMSVIWMLSSIADIVMISAVMLSYDFRLTILALVSVLPYFFMLMLRGNEFYKVQFAQAKRRRKMDYLWSLFGNKSAAKEMRVLGFDPHIAQRWRETRTSVNDEIYTQNRLEAASLLMCDVFRVAGYGLSVALTLALVSKGSITVGMFAACIGAFSTAQSTTENFLRQSAQIKWRTSRVADFMDFLNLPEEENGKEILPELTHGITVKDLFFTYPSAPSPAITDVSLDILPGETVALVGENGSGKTTLARLILGLYEPESGMVEYDGVPVSQIDRDSICPSAVAQNFTEYQLSLGENVALSEEYDKEKISSLLTEMGLSELSKQDPSIQLGREFGGYELSRGQWQRLAITRALYPDSHLLVLDEPTAALDPMAETEILKSFIKAVENKTALIITHRVGICRYADKIAVMDKGRIVEIGSHTELMGRHGKYYEMYQAQGKWYK